jgi:hypothetical protein
MDNKYVTVKIKRTTLEIIRKLADMNYRSVPQQIEAMADAFETMNIQSVTQLPHPPGANAIPVVHIYREEQE